MTHYPFTSKQFHSLDLLVVQNFHQFLRSIAENLEAFKLLSEERITFTNLFYPCLTQAQVETTTIISLPTDLYLWPQTTLTNIKEPCIIRLKHFCHVVHKPVHLLVVIKSLSILKVTRI